MARPDKARCITSGHSALTALLTRGLCTFLCLLLLSGVIHPAEPPAHIRIAGSHYLGDLPTFVAHEQGLFEREGLRVGVTYSHTGQENLTRLRNGDTDYALMALTPIVLDRLADETPGQGDDPVILANLVHSTSLNRVVTPASSDIRSADDLRGRRIGLATDTSSEFIWWVFAHFHGLDPDSVQRIDIDANRIPDALTEGRIDAAVLWEPSAARAFQHGDAGLRTFTGSNIYTARWVLVSTPRIIASDRQALHSILKAYQGAIEFIHRRPEQVMADYASWQDVSLENLGEYWNPWIHQLDLNWSLLAALQQQMNWALRSQVGHVNDPDILSLVDTVPLRSVSDSAVGIPAWPGNETGP